MPTAMMMLTSANSEAPIWISPEHIVAVGDFNEGSLVWMVGGAQLPVNEQPEDISERRDRALALGADQLPC